LGTGTNRGLGQAIASALADEGARLLCHARTEEKAQAAAALVGGEPVWGDLETQVGVPEVARVAAFAAPELHVLVHNAGVGSPGGIDDHSRKQWERVLAVNAAAPLFLTQAL